MKLTSQVEAPIFNRKDIFGREINLENYRNKKLLIAFFRHAGCPFCNLRVHALTKVHQDLKNRGLEMLFFFESKENVLLRSIFHKEVSPIPLMADPTKEIYDRYGLESSAAKSAKSHIVSFVQTAFQAKKQGVPMHGMADGESINTIPAEFLVDKDLRIKKVHYSNSLTDRLDLKIIDLFADDSSIFDHENVRAVG